MVASITCARLRQWRKVQEVGLTNAYKDNDQVRAFVGKMDALAFLPEDRVADGMTHLWGYVPNEPGVLCSEHV